MLHHLAIYGSGGSLFPNYGTPLVARVRGCKSRNIMQYPARTTLALSQCSLSYPTVSFIREAYLEFSEPRLIHRVTTLPSVFPLRLLINCTILLYWLFQPVDLHCIQTLCGEIGGEEAGAHFTIEGEGQSSRSPLHLNLGFLKSLTEKRTTRGMLRCYIQVVLYSDLDSDNFPYRRTRTKEEGTEARQQACSHQEAGIK
jgi:hypothetical protein